MFELTAQEAIRGIRAGRFTSTEWVRSCLARIAPLEPELRAWAYLDPELPLRQAELADRLRKSGGTVGALEGAPIGVKDIFNTAEMPTEMGSPLWKGFTPGNDARVVATLKLQGAIVLGKTVTSEFAVHSPGPTRNPRQPDRSPGTSSSGSAAAVAAGMVPFALGSQTAGSTVRPASYCGVYGFKPSFGLVPRTGMLKTTDTLDHVCFFARSPEDIQLLFDAARVRGRDHPIVEERVDPTQEAPLPARWAVGFVRGPAWDEAQPYAREALERFAGRLGAVQGIRVQEVRLPPDFSRVHDIHQRIYCRMLAYYFQEESRTPALLSDSFRAMLEQGRGVSLAEYRDGLKFQAAATRQLDRLFKEAGLDVLINLSTGGEAPAYPDGQDLPDNCLLWTFCGVPVLGAPAFLAPSGLPLGLQIVGRKYGDYPLLRFTRFLLAEGLLEPVRLAEPQRADSALVGDPREVVG